MKEGREKSYLATLSKDFHALSHKWFFQIDENIYKFTKTLYIFQKDQTLKMFYNHAFLSDFSLTISRLRQINHIGVIKSHPIVQLH